MWRHLWPGEPAEPVGCVTNGVHTPSWVGPEMRAPLRPAPWTPTGRSTSLDPEHWKKIQEVPDEELWAAHRAQKERLVRFVRERVRQQSARHGSPPDELREIEGLLDPHALTIGFARRFATYKRAVLCSPTWTRLRALLSDAAAAGAAPLRGQGASRRPRRPGGHPPPGRPHPGRVPGQGGLPRGLRHRDGAHAGPGLRRLAQHPAASPGGLRHHRPEGARSTAAST